MKLNMQAISFDDAKNKAIEKLNQYKKSGDFTDLESAVENDNTNTSILFEYLKYLSVNDKEKYLEELKKYKFLLPQDICTKLGTKYIDHQKDLIYLIDSLQNINSDEPDKVKAELKQILKEYYPKEDKEIIDQKCDKRVNNLPLDDLENDIIFYLTLKIEFGRHLHGLSDFSIDENNTSQIREFKISISYFKVLGEILKNYITKNERKLAFNLVNILDLFDYGFDEPETMSRLNYFLIDLNLDKDRIQELAGQIYKSLITSQNYYVIINKYMKNYEKLFFELLEDILKSNCIKKLIMKLEELQKDNYNVMSNDIYYNNYIKYIKKNISFYPFFNKEYFGLTTTLNGKILISNDYRSVKLSKTEGNLYNFCIWIITGIHEAIGHFLKDYFYYLSKFVISEETSDENSTESVEGGIIVEGFLFKKTKEIFLSDVLYILDIKNWNKNLDEFSEYFSSEKRAEIIKNGLKKENLSSISEECFEILSKFNIYKSDLTHYKTNISINCKKSESQPCIDLSERLCIKKKKNKNKLNN